MKKLNTLLIAFVLIFSTTAFAQKSTNFNGTYKMDYGNQRMEIIPDGGMYYHVKFIGDCNAKTHQGRVDNGALLLPMGSNDRDFIMISWQGEKLRVDVRGTDHMRKACGGTSIVGLYSLKNSYNNDRYNDTRYERSYKPHVSVNDLKGMAAIDAYEELMDRGFEKRKKQTYGGTTYGVWYNRETHQCIKTVSKNKRITDIMKSTHCFN